MPSLVIAMENLSGRNGKSRPGSNLISIDPQERDASSAYLSLRTSTRQPDSRDATERKEMQITVESLYAEACLSLGNLSEWI